MLGIFAVILASTSACLQDTTLEGRIRQIVDDRYADTPEEHRALVARRIAAVLGGYPGAGPEKIEAFVNYLDQTFRYVQSFVHVYDLRAQGSTSWPPLPEAMKTRQLELELRYAETYFREGLEARPLAAGSREAITGQVDGLIHQVRNLIASRVVGPHALEAIDGALTNMRHNLLGTFDSPISENFPRLLSSEEVEGILEQVRKSADGLKDNLEVNETLKSLRDDPLRDRNPDPEVRKQRALDMKRHNEIVGTIDGISKPLYDIFDVWGPDRAKIRKELEQLRKEVQAWQVEFSAEMKRKEREKSEVASAMAPAPPRATGPPRPIPATAPARPKPKAPDLPRASDVPGPPWGLIVLFSLALSLTALAIRKATSRRFVDRR